MTTQDYQRKSPLAIFFHYFGNHRRLFAIDLSCALCLLVIIFSLLFILQSQIPSLPCAQRCFRSLPRHEARLLCLPL